jgi:GNAT superfamily N-acetyltransferase
MIEIGRLSEQDRAEWQVLFKGYNDFYERELPQEQYDTSWQGFMDDTRIHALGAKLDGKLVGITHFLVHASTSGPDVCYLQDLFTAREARGQGVARKLIEAVVEWAKARDLNRVYWLTQETNTAARKLYDQVAVNRGFIHYLIPLA